MSWNVEHRTFVLRRFLVNNESVTQTQRDFRCHFNIPIRRPVPDRNTILRWVDNFNTTGSVMKKKPPGPVNTARTPENIERVRASAIQSPEWSVRLRAASLGINESTVRRILHKDLHYHPNKIQEPSSRSLMWEPLADNLPVESIVQDYPEEMESVNNQMEQEPMFEMIPVCSVKQEEEVVKEEEYRPIKLEPTEVEPIQVMEQKWLQIKEEDPECEFNVSATDVEPKDEVTIDDHILKMEEGPDKSPLPKEDISVSETYQSIEVSQKLPILPLRPAEDSTMIISEDPSVSDVNANATYKSEDYGKRFSSSGNLKTHLKNHVSENPYKCDECGRSFVEHYKFVRHQKIHSGEKYYKIDDCKMRFTRQYYPASHSRSRSGKKRYNCDDCGRSFSRLAALKIHIVNHLGESPYKCDDCGKCFTQSCNFTRHLNFHSLEKSVTQQGDHKID